jgi:hypothetical protein
MIRTEGPNPDTLLTRLDHPFALLLGGGDHREFHFRADQGEDYAVINVKDKFKEGQEVATLRDEDDVRRFLEGSSVIPRRLCSRNAAARNGCVQRTLLRVPQSPSESSTFSGSYPTVRQWTSLSFGASRWRGQDSNLRRQSQRVYSASPLTAREPRRGPTSLRPAPAHDTLGGRGRREHPLPGLRRPRAAAGLPATSAAF